MTVDHIIPCVCTPHPPTCADRTTYGKLGELIADGRVVVLR